MANIIDFIEKMSTDKGLAQEVTDQIKTASPNDLSDWFKNKGYDVTADDCQKLLNNRNELWDIGDTSLRSNY